MAYTTIKKPGDYFNTKLYTGNNGTHAITGVGFQPDFIWLKPRNLADHHRLMNSVSSADTFLKSNSNGAEDNTGVNFSSFDSDGFTLGGNNGGWNSSSYNYTSWNWKANGTGSANTDGSISSTVSVSATSGFSIVKYTGTGANATVGHGLGVAPKMIIVKNTEATENWLVYHQSLENTSALKLNQTNAKGSTSAYWNNTSPTSSTFSLGASSEANTNADVNIAYCFRDVVGYSKFGSYVGNGNANGAFVYTGFKPAFVLLKNTNAVTNWQMNDSARDTFNVVNKRLAPNVTDAESSSSYQFGDFLSNGFKIRETNDTWNGNGNAYIFMAFAEQPLIGDNPATAR